MLTDWLVRVRALIRRGAVEQALFTDLAYRIRALFQRRKMDADLGEELQLHLDLQAAKHARVGVEREEALRRARIELGGIELAKERTRESRGVRLIEATIQDVAYTCRVLRKSPGFAATVVLSLALGMGANTAIFTLMDAVMWRMLPVTDPEHLLVAGQRHGETIQSGFTYGQFRLMRDNNAVANLAGYTTAPINVAVDGPPEPSVEGQLVTGDYFSLLGVRPVLGRAIGPDDDRVPNGHPVAMLSHGYWERRFARDPLVIGRTIRLSAVPFTIIGVTPPEFFGVEVGTAPELFLPMMMQPTLMSAFENLLEDPIVSRTWVHVVARTKQAVTPDQAASALEVLLKGQENLSGPAAGPGAEARIVLTPAAAVSALRRQFSRPLFVLLAMVGVVLLIACANTANLLLARAAARRPEFAMRLALGASRHRLIRQLLVESLVLATISGVCGVLLAHWATRALVVYLSSGRAPIVLDLTPNLRILAFTGAVSASTGLLFGLAPAWRATGTDVTLALRNVRNALTRSARPGRVLVIAQLALSLLLLVGAGLFVRTLHELSSDTTSGLRQSVMMLRVEPRGSDQRNIAGTSERLDRIYRELIRRAEETPGVRAASMANGTPSAPTSSAAIPITMASGDLVRVPALMVYPNYFATIGIPVVAGRDFVPADLGERAPAVCIVNESFVRQFFPGEDPLGKPCYTGRRARLLGAHGHPQAPLPPEAFVIVGVAKDSRYSNPLGEARPVIYRTFLQSDTGRGQMVLHVRVAGNRGDVVQRIRKEVAALDATVPIFDVHTLEEEMNAALAQQRLVAMLSSFFGALALLLAAVGLYGLLAFTVVQRKLEMGIRIALGARRGHVVWLVVSEALLLVAIGTALGVPAALGLARLASKPLSSLLFGLEATDPLTIGIAAIALATVATFAAYVPARRASRVDPMLVLKAE